MPEAIRHRIACKESDDERPSNVRTCARASRQPNQALDLSLRHRILRHGVRHLWLLGLTLVSGSAVHYCSALKSDGGRRPDGYIRHHRHGRSATLVPMASEWLQYLWRNLPELH